MGERTSTRERIVEAATKLFWLQGYHLVSTDLICRAAEVRRSSLYHAFPSKADVLAASLEWVWERNWREISAAYAGDDDIRMKFRRHLTWFHQSQLRLHAETGAFLGTFDMALGVALPDSVLSSMRTHQSHHGKLLESSIARIIEAEGGDISKSAEVTQIVHALIVASNYRARLMNDDEPLRLLPGLTEQAINAFAGRTLTTKAE
jgi:AcrR family transcriptional regulator